MKLKDIWKKISGKKTITGIILHSIWFGANLIYPNLADSSQRYIGHGIIFNITGVGVGHKLLKFFKKK